MDAPQIASVTVRPIRESDVPPVTAACEWLFTPPGGRPPLWDASAAAARLTALVGAPDAAAFVAELDDRVVGFCTVYLDLVSIRMGQRAWMNELAVDPQRRSLGIGRQLLEHARAWSRDHGATHFMVDSSTARTDAHRFYRREQPAYEALCFGWFL